MPNLFEAMKHPKAMQEFGQYAQAIYPVMMDATISKAQKRKTLNELVENLSEGTFKLNIIAEQITVMIDTGQKSDAICKEYEDTESQVNAILEWLPRMEKHRDLLTKTVEKHRKQYGL